MWKEETVFNFVRYVEIYVWRLRKVTKILSQYKQSPECDLRVRPLEHKAEITPIEIQKGFIFKKHQNLTTPTLVLICLYTEWSKSQVL